MDAAYISTVAALAGSAIGALASFATSWVTQSSQAHAAQRAQDRAVAKRSTASSYAKHPSSSSMRLNTSSTIRPSPCDSYEIVSTIRLFGGPQTLEEAERIMKQIGAAYFAPNKELRLFADITTAANWTRCSPSARPADRSLSFPGHRCWVVATRWPAPPNRQCRAIVTGDCDKALLLFVPTEVAGSAASAIL